MKITNKCQKCDTSLVIGENTTSARVKNYDWTCTRCISKNGKNYKKTKYDKLKASSQAGVYGCYLDGELVYIGESQACELRWHEHLYTSDKSKSSIGVDRTRRHDYDWKILYLEENVWRRRVKEIELIVEHKPRLNSPYRNVLAMG